LDPADDIEGATPLVATAKVRPSSAALGARRVSRTMLDSNTLIYNK
jgi:hypothetical protein